MRRFGFALNPVIQFPWEILMYLCGAGALVGIFLRNIHAVLPSVVGAFIFFLFYSMKRFSYIMLTDRVVKVRMGIFAFGEIPYSDIVKVEKVTHKAIHGIGVKACGKGEVGMVTTAGEVTRLELSKKNSLRVFGCISMPFTALRLSPEHQESFIAMVAERIG